MAVNQTGIISGVVALLALSTGGCTFEAPEEATTSSATQAIHGGSSFIRLFARPRGGHAVLPELTLGQNRLCQLQADITGDGAGNGLDDDDPDDGGWDFTLDTDATAHSANASPTNTYGATALPLIVRGTATPAATLGCAVDAALGMQAEPSVDSAPDFVFLALLSDILDDPTYAELAAERYDAKLSAEGGAQALGESIRDDRHAAGLDGLIGYDLAWYTFAALALDLTLPNAGYAEDAAAFAGIIGNDLKSTTPLFDIHDPSEEYYTDGLSWSMLALHATDQREGLQRTLKRLLLDTQLASGAFPYNQDFPDADLQSTSGALVALKLAGAGSDTSARQAAIGYLVSQQTEDGGWDYAPGGEGTLANAEILFAIGLTRDKVPAAEALSRPAASKRARARASHALVAPLD